MLSNCIFLFSVAAVVSGQQYTVFRPPGESESIALRAGSGPDPLNTVLHLTHVGVESDLCIGIVDILAVTLPAPIVGEFIEPDVRVEACLFEERQYDEYDDSSYADIQSSPVRCGESIPTCARLQLQDDPNERRTILLFNQFASFEGNSSEIFVNKIRFRSLTFLLDGNQTAVYGDNVEAYSSGQELILCALPQALVSLYEISWPCRRVDRQPLAGTG